MLISMYIKRKRGKIDTYLFGQHPYKTNALQGAESRAAVAAHTASREGGSPALSMTPGEG